MNSRHRQKKKALRVLFKHEIKGETSPSRLMYAVGRYATRCMVINMKEVLKYGKGNHAQTLPVLRRKEF